MTWLGPVTALSLVALTACAPTVRLPRPEATAIVPASRTDAFVQRNFLETPFADGPLAIEAVEGGRLVSWDIAPCRDGGAVCAGNGQGPVGQVRRTADFVVVTGLHGRTFWLSWGGDGYVGQGSRILPMAWAARVDGTGVGVTPTLESSVPHS